MPDPIANLTREHREIEEVLGALETYLDTLGLDPDNERGDLADFARFFEMIDHCHHGKEEKYLFKRMQAFGFSREKGPVSAMLSEQDEGRDHLLALAAIGSRGGHLTVQERGNVRGHGLGYIMRIRPHMKREEDILFPMVAHSLPAFVLEELGRDFENFETRMLPPDFRSEIERLSSRLTSAHPPKKLSTINLTD